MNARGMCPIDPMSEICQILSCLPEKFVVDFANGIDVARDHIRVQNERSGFFSRMYDGFTGQGTRRQAEINSSLADGVEGALTWLTDLTDSVAQSNRALAKVSDRVASIQTAIARVANYSADTRMQIENLSQHLHARMDKFSVELVRMASEQRAEQQLERAFNKWAAGRFAPFSCAGRCYAVLEELRWGDFGNFCRDTEDLSARKLFLEDLANRMIKQTRADMELSTVSARASFGAWLTTPVASEAGSDAPQALAYLGNWASIDLHPFVYTTSQSPRELPTGFPRLCSAERIAEALVDEVFAEE